MGNIDKIKMVVADVDGVLTDGSITIDPVGNELKTFNARDGSGIKYLQRVGIKFAIISGRRSIAVDIRAKELNVKDVYQGAIKKMDAYADILANHNLTDDEVCYIGDDLIDIPIMRKVGFAVGVIDAVADVLAVADYITTTRGGRGAVREVIEKIIKGQGKWQEITSRYFSGP